MAHNSRVSSVDLWAFSMIVSAHALSCSKPSPAFHYLQDKDNFPAQLLKSRYHLPKALCLDISVCRNFSAVLVCAWYQNLPCVFLQSTSFVSIWIGWLCALLSVHLIPPFSELLLKFCLFQEAFPCYLLLIVILFLYS